MTFDLCIGIDYSGAETAESRLKAPQIYAAADDAPERVYAVPEEGKTHWNWSRREIAEWLIAQIRSDARIVAGIDHAFSFPLSYMGRYGLFRLCERWTSLAKSVFRFDCQGQVAKSTHAGIPWLWHVRRTVGDRVHFWPFDGWQIPNGKSAIVEVYPSIFRNRYPREGRSADEQDAFATARWLRETCERGFLGRYLDPPLTAEERELAELDGWILGIA